MSDPNNRLDELTLEMFKKTSATLAEITAINLSVYMVGSLEPIGHIERHRQDLIEPFDGEIDDQQAFREMYDWDRVVADLESIREKVIKESGISLDIKQVAQELETLARWIRLQK